MLYTTTQAADHATKWRRFGTGTPATVTPAAIRKWASRGHLDPAGLDDQGHPLYALVDIARAEKATRKRALRLVGVGAH
ncbi:MerR family transcriptional regulator [Streptomyces sp. NPDC091280]|uniref:MerR family transcriptional regulator n=1 Tax=Streptomyces sp. NPDC091280 TaxID=3365984 RepID=UPI00380A633B